MGSTTKMMIQFIFGFFIPLFTFVRLLLIIFGKRDSISINK